MVSPHRMVLRLQLLSLLTLLLGTTARAQRLIGSFEQNDGRPGSVVLWSTYGQDHFPVDTTFVDRKGRFAFDERSAASGFYQLSVSDSDRVDLILDPRENSVELRFDGLPLREHIAVVRSLENQRLWEYKRASRSYGSEISSLRQRRATSDPLDATNLLVLDSLEREAVGRRESALERLILQDPTSYFSKVVGADQQLTAAIPRGPLAIRDAMDWTDASLVRSSVYPNAITAILQSATPASTDVLSNASDSLLKWAEPDPVCWRFTRAFLINLFSEYAADELVQHLVDAYITGPGTLYPPGPELLQLVAAQLRVSIGSQAPDVLLPDPLRGDTVSLSELRMGSRCTALFFYSSTCDHCHEQMPGLVSLYNGSTANGLQVIGIALDNDRADFIRTIAEEQLSFRCFSELNAWGSQAAKAFAVKATPTFIVLDGQGVIIGKPFDHEELRTMVLPLLNEGR